MTELDISIVAGPVRVVPIPATFTDLTLLTGPSELIGFSVRDATGENAAQNTGSVTSPIAAQVIVQTGVLPAGAYDVQWTVSLQGAAAAADTNNFKLVHGSTVVENSINAGAAGSYPQVPARVTVNAGESISIQAIAAGTVGVVYLAQIEAIPVQPVDTVVELRDGNNPLAEITLGANAADSRWYGSGGLHVRNQITLHPISGLLTGAIYARYDTLTG